ncbi:MAG: hypothetical protein GWN01_05560 [Nitrosopumilaceae archaeon]|nr:hypothetical protein [Nitrosopumilaceae archaeon]NIU86815.1 hypothetical protein [Nitrosopumilaceae archaeon]NIX61012.1 hypothetical protein [Nitrosopumilaceae archaeon]
MELEEINPEDSRNKECKECGKDMFYVNNNILVCVRCGHPHLMEELM